MADFAVEPVRDARARPRARTLLRGKLAYGEPQLTVGCVIRNISQIGAMVDAEVQTLLPREVMLLNVHEGVVYEARIAWHSGQRIGLDFIARHDLHGDQDPRFYALRRLWAELSPR